MPMPYLRKQTIVIFVICLIAVAGTVAYTEKNRAPKQNSEEKIVNTKIIQPTIATNSDWKKTFSESTVKTPSLKNGTTTAGKDQPEVLNETDRLGREFFMKFAQLKQAGLTTDSEAVKKAADQLAENTLANLPTPKIYQLTDIKISIKTDIESQKNYANAVSNTLNLYIPAQNEAEILLNAFEKNDMKLLAGIDPIISKYRSAVTNLLLVPVPQILVQYHLELLNGLSIQLFNSQTLRKADINPVPSLAALKLEVQGLELIAQAVSEMQSYFTLNKIEFKPQISFVN
jgi:hypothetical protein